MKKLEEELSTVDNDTGLLSIDTKIKTESQPQVSPYYNTSGNPLVSQYNHVANSQTPQPKSSPVLGLYGREESYTLKNRKDAAPLPDVTQHGPKLSTPMIVQQVVPSPLYVNIAPGTLQQVPDRTPLVQLDGVAQVNQPTKAQRSQPLLIQNGPKGVTPLILKTTDASFSPVILQSNIINPETQTLMYTTAPVQGKFCDGCLP